MDEVVSHGHLLEKIHAVDKKLTEVDTKHTQKIESIETQLTGVNASLAVNTEIANNVHMEVKSWGKAWKISSAGLGVLGTVAAIVALV